MCIEVINRVWRICTLYINSLLNVSNSCLKSLYCDPTNKVLQSTIICSRMSSFWTSRCVTIELFILSMIFCLNFILAVSVTGHSRMKCFRFSIPFPHNGQVQPWMSSTLWNVKAEPCTDSEVKHSGLSERPCLLTNQDEMSNLYREPSIDASYQVSVHLAKGFQMRRLKWEKLTDDGRQLMVKARIAFGNVS